MSNHQEHPSLTAEARKELAQRARAAEREARTSSEPTLGKGAMLLFCQAATPQVVLSLLEEKPQYGIAMDGCAQQLGLDMFDYHDGDVYRAISELQRVAALGEGDGGVYALQSLASYFRESGNWDAYRAIRNAAHLANLCIDEGGADQMNGFASECPLCGDHFRD